MSIFPIHCTWATTCMCNSYMYVRTEAYSHIPITPLAHTHTHTHTCMYPPHCQHHMQCTHSLLVMYVLKHTHIPITPHPHTHIPITPHAHRHTHVYPPHCQYHMQCTHYLLVYQHSVLHAATRAHTLPTPGLLQQLVPCTHTTNATRKGRGWKREVLFSLQPIQDY